MTTVSRPNRGDTIGYIRGDRVVLTEEMEVYLDELEQSITEAESSASTTTESINLMRESLQEQIDELRGLIYAS